MMKYCFIPFLSFVCMVSVASGERSKPAEVQHLLGIMEALYQEASTFNEVGFGNDKGFASYNEFCQAARKVAEEAVADLESPEQLAKLTVIARAMYSGKAEFIRFDEVFFQTYRLCIEKLAETPSQENYTALKYVQRHLCLTGEGSMHFKAIMQTFEQRFGQLEE